MRKENPVFVNLIQKRRAGLPEGVCAQKEKDLIRHESQKPEEGPSEHLAESGNLALALGDEIPLWQLRFFGWRHCH